MIISSRENEYSEEGIRMADEGDFEMEKVGKSGITIWPYLNETQLNFRILFTTKLLTVLQNFCQVTN